MNNQLVVLSICSIAAIMMLAGSAPEADAAAYMKIEGIDGEATDSEHKDWIIIESMSSPIFRTVSDNAKDSQRTKGETTLGDVVVVRQLDKSSVKLQEACANGSFNKDAVIEFTRLVPGSDGSVTEQTYLKYELKNVIITSYSFHGTASDPLPTEEVTLGYTEVEWTYSIYDPETGEKTDEVIGNYSLGKGKK